MANFSEQQLRTTFILLFVVVPSGLCHMNCDIGGCAILFQSTFSNLLLNGLESLCRTVGDVLNCMKDCHKIFFPHFISINSTIYFLNQVCNGDFIYDITDENWNCIRQHFNRLLTCIATSNSMESLQHKHDNRKLLACRKVLMILDCPGEVLYDQCEDKVVEAVNEAFQLGLKPLLETSCYKISSSKASNLNVLPRLPTEYHKTAICMDNDGDLASQCFHEYLEKAAHSELNSCSEDAETTCKEPVSSVPCSSQSFIRHFYSTMFSFGKQKCDSPAPNISQSMHTSTSSATEANVNESFESADKTLPFMKDAISDVSLPMERVTHPQLELNITASSISVDDLKKSFSAINPTTDDQNREYDDVVYPSTSTILPDHSNEGSVLSDAPESNSISFSNSIIFQMEFLFVSFTCIFSVIVVVSELML